MITQTNRFETEDTVLDTILERNQQDHVTVADIEVITEDALVAAYGHNFLMQDLINISTSVAKRIESLIGRPVEDI